MVITLVLHVGISQNQMAVLPCRRELHTLGNYTLDVIASALVITQNEKKNAHVDNSIMQPQV